MLDNTYTGDLPLAMERLIQLYFLISKQEGVLMVNKKEKDIIIVNKFKEKSKNDVKSSVEKVFKMYYELQVNKKSV